MRTMTMMLALVLAACGGCDETGSKTAPKPFGLEVVGVEYHDTAPWQTYGSYALTMQITGPDVAQELRLTNRFNPVLDTQLVEFFHARGDHIDTHSGFRGETREMLMYPASVEGERMAGDWTILVTNLDGSFVTSANAVTELGMHFNGEPAGRVVSADMAKAIHWRTEAREDRVYLWIDDVEHPLPFPKAPAK